MKKFKQLSSPIFVNKLKTTSAGAVTQCKTGASLGDPKYKSGDVCLAAKGKVTSKVFMNSTVLRSAILNSREFFIEELGLDIREIGTHEVTAAEKQPEIIKPTIIVEPTPTLKVEEDLEAFTIADLKVKADKLGIEYTSNIRKADLIDLIKGA